jgi:hypothetical protein
MKYGAVAAGMQLKAMILLGINCGFEIPTAATCPSPWTRKPASSTFPVRKRASWQRPAVARNGRRPESPRRSPGSGTPPAGLVF